LHAAGLKPDGSPQTWLRQRTRRAFCSPRKTRDSIGQEPPRPTQAPVDDLPQRLPNQTSREFI